MAATPLSFTPLRISTLVTTGHLGAQINLTNLFNQIQPLLIPIGYPAEGILKMEHESKVIGHSARDMLTKRRVSDKTFFNQSTLVIRKLRGGDGPDAKEYKEVNVKLFANGGFQMTGVTSEEFSKVVLESMLETFKQLQTPLSETSLKVAKFAIQLLNSDYKMSALLKRAELHRILCQEYQLSSTLETTIYQGVNTKYYYNEEQSKNPQHRRGICMCPKFCNGQGDGKSIGSCKKITIAAFQTGSIIITGARNREQLDEAYAYMNEVLQKHRGAITKPPVAPAPA
jgi:TATA-box binding protein (TBP) (component of TFIID and TFIIIB)